MVQQEFEAYAQEAAASLLPEVPSPAVTGADLADIWKLNGEGSYRSAFFKVAVRSKLMREDACLEENGQDQMVLSFQGSAAEGPELEHLHSALVLFTELSKVQSPLQDSLRFLLRQLCRCIFDEYKPGCDVMILTPFWIQAHQAKVEAAADRERAKEAERRASGLEKQLKTARAEIEQLRNQLYAERERSQQSGENFESLLQERNQLKIKLGQVEESRDICYEELRRVSSELASLQGSSYIARRELEQSKKDLNISQGLLKESQKRSEQFQKRAQDLQDALMLVGDTDAALKRPSISGSFRPAEGSFRPSENSLEPPPELEELLLQKAQSRRRRKSGRGNAIGLPEGKGAAPVDHRRLLKIPMPDGGTQLIMRGSADSMSAHAGVADAQGQATLQLGAGGLAVADLQFHSAPPILVVSPEAFAALSIGLALPFPPDPLHFRAGDDDAIVREVHEEVAALVTEHVLLLQLFRQLRQELKATLKLIPEWNADELRGLVRSTLVFDAEEEALVPSPIAGALTLVGLGEAPSVPPFLRFDGLLPLRTLTREDVAQLCQEVWFGKTEQYLAEATSGRPITSLRDFLTHTFLPSQHKLKTGQMELSYNFLLALRRHTTMGTEEVQHVNPLDAKEAKNRRKSLHSQSRRRSSALRDEQQAQTDSTGTSAEGIVKVLTRAEQAETHFSAQAELLYRGLLQELHEDVFHDQTAMLVVLASLTSGLTRRFAIQPGDSDTREDMNAAITPAVFTMATFGAVLRKFFVGKPREHITALKQLMWRHAQQRWRQGPSPFPPASVAATPAGSPCPSPVPGGGPASHNVGPALQGADRLIDVSELLGLPLTSDGALTAGAMSAQNLLPALLRKPTPFVSELRRQHLIECLMFMDRLHKALKVVTRSTGDQSVAATTQINAKQADLALQSTDNQLSEMQRHLYVLRGFGRRLPDMPSGFIQAQKASVIKSRTAGHSLLKATTFLTASTVSSVNHEGLDPTIVAAWETAQRLQKVQKLLQERVQTLHDEGSTVAPQDFVRRLASSGIIRGGHQWQPDVRPSEIAQESGISSVWQTTITASLGDFLDASAPEEGEGKQNMPRFIASTADSLDRFLFLAETGRDVHELRRERGATKLHAHVF